MATNEWDGIAPLQASYYPFHSDFNERDLILALFSQELLSCHAANGQYQLQVSPVIKAVDPCAGAGALPTRGLKTWA